MIKRIAYRALKKGKSSSLPIAGILLANVAVTSTVVLLGNFVLGFANDGAQAREIAGEARPLAHMQCASDNHHAFGFTPDPTLYKNHLDIETDKDDLEYASNEFATPNQEGQKKDYSDTIFSF